MPKPSTSLIDGAPGSDDQQNHGSPPAPAAAAPTEVKFYIVVSPDKQIPRQNGAFMLRQGKTVRSDNFDIHHLQSLGVELKEIPTPGWYLDAQKKTRAA